MNTATYAPTVWQKSKAAKTMNTTQQLSNFEFESGRVHTILSDLGYSPIQDFGDHYRTIALYRGGDSPNSLKVWKNSGYCIDYVANKKFPLYELLKQHIQDPRKIREILGAQKNSSPTFQKVQPVMPRTYDKACLQRLLPNYFFYRRKNISDATLKKYQMGLATTGKMYNRMVFPVFDEYGELIGFTGRHIDFKEDSCAPKWKHIGERKSWIYPFYLPSLPECREKFDKTAEIRIIESVGDSLALTEHGCENHLVNFGLGCSSQMQAFLLEKDPKTVFISTNNDSSKEDSPTGNVGKITAIKIMTKLSNVLPLEKLKIQLPVLKDIAEMHESGIDVAKWTRDGLCLTNEEIKQYVQTNANHFGDDVKKFAAKL